MAWIALDIGSSQWKAGLFSDTGQELSVARCPIPLTPDQQGRRVVPVAQVMPTLQKLMALLPGDGKLAARGIAISGMAEGGVLLQRQNNAPISDLLPWFDQRGTKPYQRVMKEGLIAPRFLKTGLPSNPKYSLFKIMALLDESGLSAAQTRWLGVPEYIAHVLTGELASEATLAARSYAFDIHTRRWDAQLLSQLGLDARMFAGIVQAGQIMGTLKPTVADRLGLASNLPVALCGHDHLCAAEGAGVLKQGGLYASAGTAQVLVRSFNNAALSGKEETTGLSYGPRPAEGLCVLGAIQSAGGSVNLFNRLFFEGDSFDAMLAEGENIQNAVAQVLYFPYLAGSGPPRMVSAAKGGIMGLEMASTKAEVLLALYQGLAFESRVILEAMGKPAQQIVICGGLTAHTAYLQLLADSLNLSVEVPSCQEGTLYGAAALMAQAAGGAFSEINMDTVYLPNQNRSSVLLDLYTKAYLPLRQVQLDYYDNEGDAPKN